MSVDPVLVLLFLTTFALGVSVGWIIRGRIHVRVHRLPPVEQAEPPPGGGMTWMADGNPDDPAAEEPRPRGRFHRLTVALDRPVVYLIGLLVAMLLGVSANVLSYYASSQTGDLANCNATYNVDAGKARDERADVAAPDRVSERALWVTFKRQIKAPQGSVTTRDVLRTIKARIAAIDAVDETTLKHPYPDPERCR